MNRKFQIGDKVYDWHDVEELSLWLLLELEAETRGTAQPLDVATVQGMVDELGKIPNDDARAKHPYGMWVFGVSVWASRRLAGEDVTFREAIDFPFRQLQILPEPADRKKPAPRANPTKRPSSRQGSAAAARNRGGASTKKTSPTASTAG